MAGWKALSAPPDEASRRAGGRLTVVGLTVAGTARPTRVRDGHDQGAIVGPAAFRRIAAAWDPAMFIVTTAAAGRRAGCLVGFAMQASIRPPRMLVGISRENRTHAVACEATALAVHCPSARDLELAELFGGESGDDTDKFSRCRWHPGPRGLPMLDDCATWLVGDIIDRLPMGDHTGHLCEVVDARAGGEPQLRYRQVRHLTAGHEA